MVDRTTLAKVVAATSAKAVYEYESTGHIGLDFDPEQSIDVSPNALQHSFDIRAVKRNQDMIRVILVER